MWDLTTGRTYGWLTKRFAGLLKVQNTKSWRRKRSAQIRLNLSVKSYAALEFNPLGGYEQSRDLVQPKILLEFQQSDNWWLKFRLQDRAPVLRYVIKFHL